MSKRERAGLQRSAKRFLEPGETVQIGLWGSAEQGDSSYRYRPQVYVAAFAGILATWVALMLLLRGAAQGLAAYVGALCLCWYTMNVWWRILRRGGLGERRNVVLTDQHVYVARPRGILGSWRMGAGSVLAKYRLGSVAVEVAPKRRGRLLVDGHVIYFRGYWPMLKPAQTIAAAAQESVRRPAVT